MATIELNTLSPIKWIANFSAVAPTLDLSNGVVNGDIALDTITLGQWRCKDNTISSPVWISLDTTAGLTNSTNKNLLTDAQVVLVNNAVQKTTTVNGYALSTNVTLVKADVGLGNVANVDTTTTANISSSTDKRFCTDAQKVVIGNTSNTNTGDETQSTIKTKLGAANVASDGYLTSADWGTFNTASTVASNAVPKTTTVNGHALSGNVVVTAYDVGLGAVANVNTTTTSAITDSTDKRFVTDAELAVVANTSGINTGNQDLSGLVPYTGANKDIDIGSYSVLTAGNVAANIFVGKVAAVSNVAGSVATDATDGSIFTITLTGDVTLANPTGAVNGQAITYWISQDGSGNHVTTLDSKFDVPTGASLVWSTAADKMDMLSVRYNAAIDKFYVVSFISGYSAT